MRKLMVFFATTLGGWLGWWIGDKVGLMTAFLLSMVGTGLGLYLGRRFTEFYG